MSGGGRQRWRENWRAVAAPDTVRVNLGMLRRTAEFEPQLQSLPRGTLVLVSASAPGARHRCLDFATRAGIEVEREYLAFPSATTPGYLVEDAQAPVRFFLDRVLVPPPHRTLALPLAAALHVLRAIVPSSIVRLMAPGRVLVGRSG